MKAIDEERLDLLFEEDFLYQFVEFIEFEYDYDWPKSKKKDMEYVIHIKKYRRRYIWYLFNYRKKEVKYDPIIQLMHDFVQLSTRCLVLSSDSDNDESNLATDQMACDYCGVEIPYIKDKDRYVTCPHCHMDIFVGLKEEHKFNKSQIKKFLQSLFKRVFKRTINI